MKLVSIAERKQFRICKIQKHKNAKTQKCKKVLNQFSQFTRKTHSTYFAAKKEDGKSEHWGCASLAFSISYGQAKEMATHNGSHLAMYQALASISGDDKICRATVECIICHFTTLGNGDTREAGAMRESIIPNLLY